MLLRPRNIKEKRKTDCWQPPGGTPRQPCATTTAVFCVGDISFAPLTLRQHFHHVQRSQNDAKCDILKNFPTL